VRTQEKSYETEAAGKASESVGIIFPTGMLGGGFSREMVHAGIEMGATAIAVVMLLVSFLLLLGINVLQRWSSRRLVA